MEKSHDVVIIGASFAGLYCAKELANSDFSVLIIEKDTELGNKFCAMGVTDDDIVFIPESEYNFPLSPIYVSYEKGEIRAPKGEGLISSIDRKKVLNKIWKKISRSSNLELSLNTKISKIAQKKK